MQDISKFDRQIQVADNGHKKNEPKKMNATQSNRNLNYASQRYELEDWTMIISPCGIIDCLGNRFCRFFAILLQLTQNKVCFLTFILQYFGYSQIYYCLTQFH